MPIGLYLFPLSIEHCLILKKNYLNNETAAVSASAGVKICLANLAKDQNFL